MAGVQHFCRLLVGYSGHGTAMACLEPPRPGRSFMMVSHTGNKESLSGAQAQRMAHLPPFLKAIVFPMRDTVISLYHGPISPCGGVSE